MILTRGITYNIHVHVHVYTNIETSLDILTTVCSIYPAPHRANIDYMYIMYTYVYMHDGMYIIN